METNANILIKSEKIPQNKKKRIVWIVVAVVFVVTLLSYIVDYIGYKKGQEFGLVSAGVASELGGTSWFSSSDSYAEKCEKAYRKLSSYTPDFAVNGKTFDSSYVRETESATRDAFYNLMKKGGFDHYSSYRIADWFRYTNPIQYYTGYYWSKVIPIIFYMTLALAIIYTVILNNEAKKELIVYADSVLCKINAKNSKQLVFEDIDSVNCEKNSLVIGGAGISYKISNVKNAEVIKAAIIDKKKVCQKKPAENKTNSSDADELKKFKILLDDGVISQEEYNAKKKQILGL